MWSSVVRQMTERAARIPRAATSQFNHFAAVVNRRGQILATGFNSGTEHAEEAVIRHFSTRIHQPYVQRHKPALPRLQPKPRRSHNSKSHSPCREKRPSKLREKATSKVDAGPSSP